MVSVDQVDTFTKEYVPMQEEQSGPKRGRGKE